MNKTLWTITEVMEIYHVDEDLLQDLERGQLLYPICQEDPPTKLFSEKDMETLRLAKILLEDMDVNLAGIEVILRMRETMFQMRRQFDDILEDLARQIQEKLKP